MEQDPLVAGCPLPDDMQKKLFYDMRVQDVLRLVNVASDMYGLTNSEVLFRRSLSGPNQLPSPPVKSVCRIICGQFFNTGTFLLGAVFVIGLANFEWVDAGVVLAVILINSSIGAVQEIRAEKSLKAIRGLVSESQATVIRNGSTFQVPVEDLVVGDVVELRHGQFVPADLRLTSTGNLEIDESILTGEAVSAVKHEYVIEAKGETAEILGIGDRTNMAFRQTVTTQGYGRGVVVRTGVYTEMGQIAQRLGTPGKKSQLTRSMDRLMYTLMFVGLVFAVLIFWAFHWHVDKVALLYASAVIVAILPESAVVLMTAVMAMGSRAMAKQQAIVRKMTALEQLGKVTDICSDKTGTLTQGRMSPTCVLVYSSRSEGIESELLLLALSGQPMSILSQWYVNTVSTADNEIPDLGVLLGQDKRRVEAWNRILMVSALCSSVQLHVSNIDSTQLSGGGNPTDVALQELVYKGTIATPSLTTEKLAAEGETTEKPVVEGEATEGEEGSSSYYSMLLRDWERRGEWPFDSTNKCMSSGWRHRDFGRCLCLVKGGPEIIIAKCHKLDEHERAKLQVQILSMAKQGLRVLALAYRDDLDLRYRTIDELERKEVESDLTLAGLVGIRDPPKPESRAAVAECLEAGIRVRMLTGDHQDTAVAIAREIGILPAEVIDQPTGMDPVLSLVSTGPKIDAMSDADLDKLIELPIVIARSSPQTKVKMVEALQRRGFVVAMTGDGVNDSMAIKEADIGVAMGISGSDVTKDVADIVLADDNFATIVTAVREGRRIFDSISKFMLHLLSGNMGEALAFMLSLLFVRDVADYPVYILSPLAILWINTLTGLGFPALALTLDPSAPDLMKRPPITHGLFHKDLVLDSIFYGIIIGTLTLGAFSVTFWYIGNGALPMHCNEGTMGCDTMIRARGTTFMVLNVLLSSHALHCRHPHWSLLSISLLTNKWLLGTVLLAVLITAPLVHVPYVNTVIFRMRSEGPEWVLLLVCFFVHFVCVEIYKWFKRRFRSTNKPATMSIDVRDMAVNMSRIQLVNCDT